MSVQVKSSSLPRNGLFLQAVGIHVYLAMYSQASVLPGALWYLPHCRSPKQAGCESQLVNWNSSDFRPTAQLKEITLCWEGHWYSMVVGETQVSCLSCQLLSGDYHDNPCLHLWPSFSLTFQPLVPSRSVTSPSVFYLVLHADFFKTAINFSKNDYMELCARVLHEYGIEPYRGNVWQL